MAGTLTRLRTAVLAHDEAAFTAATLDRDGFGSTVAMIWSNLAALAPTTFDWSTTGLTGSLPAARADRLGPGAQLVQTEVSWAVAGDATPARQLIWLTLVPDPTGALLVAATTDRPLSNSEVLPAPLWLLEPLRVVTGARCTVFGGLSTDLTALAAVLDRAAVAVAARVPAGLRPRWTQRLVAELPSNETMVERVLGAAPGARAGLAAITWPESTDQASAPLRIVVNPAATNGLPTLGLDVLATHEATHVATRSPLSPAPLWLVEGFADWVAYDRWPAAARPALDPLLDAVLAGRGPTRLPSDADFDAGAPDLDLRYAEAWTACRYVATSAGPAALTRLYAAAQPPGTEIAEVVRRVLGRSPSEVVRGWRTDLEREARARAGARAEVARTLVVTNDFPPRIGGIEAFVAQVCRLLDDDVVVLTSHAAGDAAHDAGLPYDVVRTAHVLLPTPAVRDRAVTLLHTTGADRVVFGAAAPLGLLGPALRSAGAERLVALSHGHEIWWARLPVSRTLLRRIGDGVDHLGVISAFTRSRIARALSPTAQDAMLALPPPVDLDVFHPSAATVRPGRCVAAARLVRQKGLDTLLRAWARLPTHVARELVVVGDGPDRRRLGRLTARLDLEVRFTGAVPHAAVPALLASAQVVALPVRTRLAGLNPEGLGLGFVEAAACGRPVLVGRSGGAPETVVDGVTGHVLDPDDVDGWARRLAELLADPDRADALGAAGRAYVGPRFGTASVGARLRRALDLPLT